MRSKISNLTKKVLPFLAIPILASSAYGIEKKLAKNFLRVNPEIPKFEEIDYSRENKPILYENFPNEKSFYVNRKEGNKELFPIYIAFSGDSGSYHFDRSVESNEKNFVHGIGFRLEKNKKIFGMQFDKDIDFFAFGTTNSSGYYSRAIGFNKKEFCTNNQVNICGGWGWGIVDGYPKHDFKPHLIKYPLIHASIEYEKIGIDTYFSTVVIMWTFKIKAFEF